MVKLFAFFHPICFIIFATIKQKELFNFIQGQVHAKTSKSRIKERKKSDHFVKIYGENWGEKKGLYASILPLKEISRDSSTCWLFIPKFFKAAPGPVFIIIIKLFQSPIPYWLVFVISLCKVICFRSIFS